jgi:hypothetical protein
LSKLSWRTWIKVCNIHFPKQKGRAISDPTI